MTDIAAAAPSLAESTATQGRTVSGLWLVLVSAACAFAGLGLTRNPTLFLAMAAIAAGSLMMGSATAGVDGRTGRSLRLLQTLGMICCVTVLLNLFS
jgi:hypothetical protein